MVIDTVQINRLLFLDFSQLNGNDHDDMIMMID